VLRTAYSLTVFKASNFYQAWGGKDRQRGSIMIGIGGTLVPSATHQIVVRWRGGRGV
jgi:hypothetical protein